ncbi:MAG: addiction module antidote protein, HigA family [Candidatus Magasanikbacteria bacterium RIFOXYC2_FULL_40_16]|uniref:Addiction module antidote protein, HigA family n=1 Tax=Candidatus Magasanikbacteria bacterium RIFOXYC2_FULL_40_16 TaxID=1798703 RepID=A0A1F6NZR2_9BACT|nr:MAG: addiction module antidote protein, HigA family [Candidatus Magasanikbacteria bacterium RIFOXYA2_FULL_40_20]OGH85292.1 MAG: addiction module antidote protein, HigA family [Candidatus Magasanikbacteria bacterium RIFOXYB2_FULL_40_13]OGH89399.1 MAG: addiction module antidote protein, HigA family [Candidatus Magasanikbacteria bacterium RIFOXYC2_FULL_40_16]
MVETKLSYSPNFVVHPGETLRDELEFLNLSQVELSQRIGLSEKHISQIINGEDPITSDTAIKLELILGMPATFWSNLQKNYELNLARIASEKRIIQEVKEGKKFICYAELVELGFVEKSKDWMIKTQNLLKFFGVNSLSYIKITEATAFRQASGEFNQHSLAAWLRCGEIEANKIEIGEFNKMAIKEIIPKLKKLTTHSEGFGCKLQELCASVGIVVVFTPYFKNTKVNGSARWINNKAVIQLNTRGEYSDIFWFTFFHELGHIFLHGVKDKFLDYQGKTKDEKESEADKFAADMLIKTIDLNKFLENKPLTKQKVETFAKSIGISASIVLGRLAHDKIVSWKGVACLRDRLIIKI